MYSLALPAYRVEIMGWRNYPSCATIWLHEPVRVVYAVTIQSAYTTVFYCLTCCIIFAGKHRGDVPNIKRH